MKIPFVDLKRQNENLHTELAGAFERVFKHHQFILGDEVANFESAWGAYLGAKDVIGCTSGTDALILALLAMDIGPGDEVITVSNTFFATIEAIDCVGAKPVLVDIDAASGQMSVAGFEKAITKKTKAVIPVHMYGIPAEMKKITDIAAHHKIKCIEDAAQAHGATYCGKKAGTLADAAAFSFYPGKNLGALGDAGAVVTNDDKLAEKILSLRDHGRTGRYAYGRFGRNMRMDGFQGAFLSVKLKYLDQWQGNRTAAAKIYNEAFDQSSAIEYLKPDSDSHCSYHLYVIKSDRRDHIAKTLAGEGIETRVYYPTPCHQQPAWIEKYGTISLPVTESFAQISLALPMFGLITGEEARTVASAVLKAV